jgi:hypothetical protein
METTHVEGQFDDAPGDMDAAVSPAPLPAVAVDARTNGATFIDDVNHEEDRGLLEWSEDEEEDEHLIERDESDGPDEADFDEPRVEDEDWEMAERGQQPIILSTNALLTDPEISRNNTIV